MAQAITIVRTSERGALLITDGIRIAWVMGRTRRDDGTFTPSALAALAEGKTVAEHEADEAARRAAKEKAFQDGNLPNKAARRAASDKAFQERKLPTNVTIGVGRVTDYSPKAWKIRTDHCQCRYGRWCWKYEYLPKSVVSVEFKDHATILTMPKWFLAKNGWLEMMAR